MPPPGSAVALPANPEDYHGNLSGTEFWVHRDAHVVFMIDGIGRDILELQNLEQWYRDHGWFLDVATIKPAPPEEKKKNSG